MSIPGKEMARMVAGSRQRNQGRLNDQTLSDQVDVKGLSSSRTLDYRIRCSRSGSRVMQYTSLHFDNQTDTHTHTATGSRGTERATRREKEREKILRKHL